MSNQVERVLTTVDECADLAEHDAETAHPIVGGPLGASR